MPSRPMWLLVVAVTCLTASRAQQGAPTAQKPPQPPTFRTEANFVRVDVFATTQGKPVKDLQLTDFELREDGVPQKISTFEYVEVRTGTPQEMRAEPNTVRDSREALRNPRARVFVLFLDVPHVSIDGAWHAREPLIRLVDRLMGDEDLVGIMTPRMAASDVVFARKTQVVADQLRNRWPWGERHTLQQDELEQMYEACYPWTTTPVREMVRELIARKRERATLESLNELVTWLRDQREERKAILTVSEGWLLYRPNPKLTEPKAISEYTGEKEPIPGPDPIGVGPDGRLSRFGKSTNTGVTKSECDADRNHLSNIDDDLYFRDLIASANRANATFYTIDPRGLPVFDSAIGPDPPPTPVADSLILRSRLDSLHVLANNTDGFAVLNSNNIDKGLRRISDDLTSYYLLGYYSTNTKLDGKFRTLKVNVTRSGVELRARRGYKAATAAEVNAARTAAAPPPVPAATAAAREALEGLSRIRAGALLSAHAVALKREGTTVWVAGELAQPVAAATSAIVTISTLGATNSADVPIAAGQRGFVSVVPLRVAASGPIDVRVRVAADGPVPLTDAVRVTAATDLSMPLMFRRGPATGNRLQPAGQPQFSRTERARFDVALDGDARLTSAQVLDRNGTATSIPVTVSERVDESQRWGSADLTLAALAPGDYLLELSGTSGGQARRVLAPFRVTR